MARYLTLGAAQSGPISRTESRRDVVARRIEQLREAKHRGCELVVFTEVALTAFFPHWWIADDAELDAWFEREMPGAETQPLFDEAKRLGVGFYLGYAELAIENGKKRRFNTSLLVERDGRIVGKYRKLHLPGHTEHRPDNPFQNLEQRYFEIGNLSMRTWRAFGGVVGMCICNDRRWPETYRVLALGGAEIVVLGYNTPDHIPEHPSMNHLVDFHNQLSMQAGAYQNGLWVVGTAKAGVEEGVSQIGQSMIVAPSGEVVAMSSTLGDELVVARCDLDMVTEYRKLFNFEKNRRPELYGPIVNQAGPKPPSE
jgi:predicted amidohydrolase